MVHLAYPLAAQRKFALALVVFAAGSMRWAARPASRHALSGDRRSCRHSGTPGWGARRERAATAWPGTGASHRWSSAAARTAAGVPAPAYTFEPKIPTVYLLVDRSGSMFHCLTGRHRATRSAPRRPTRPGATSRRRSASVIAIAGRRGALRLRDDLGHRPGGRRDVPVAAGR